MLASALSARELVTPAFAAVCFARRASVAVFPGDACHAWMDRNWSTVILPRNAAGRRRCRPTAYPCPQDARSATGVPRRDKGYTVVMLLREAWMSRAEP
jgi:hypothetical protein